MSTIKQKIQEMASGMNEVKPEEVSVHYNEIS